MKIQKTLSIIKPDIVRKNKIGQIINIFESNDLEIFNMRMSHLTKEQASKFYEIHEKKPFFLDLVKFMTSGPIVVLILKG